MSCPEKKRETSRGGLEDAQWSYECSVGKLDCSLCKKGCAKSNNLLTLHDKLLVDNEALFCGDLTVCKDLCVDGRIKACNVASGTLQVAANSILPASPTNPTVPVETVSFNTIRGTGSAVQPTSVLSKPVNDVWKSAFALDAAYDESQGAIVFTIPLDIRFEKPFPKCPTVLANIASSSGEIFIDTVDPTLGPLKAILVSVTTVVDDVTVNGARLRVQASIVGNSAAVVNAFFRGLLSGGETQEPIRIGWIAYSS